MKRRTYPLKMSINLFLDMLGEQPRRHPHFLGGLRHLRVKSFLINCQIWSVHAGWHNVFIHLISILSLDLINIKAFILELNFGRMRRLTHH